MAERIRKPKLTINVRLEQARPEELPEMMAYAFDATGQFLAAAPVPKGEQSQVTLELPPELVRTTVRVVLGPRQVEEREEIPRWMAAPTRRGETQRQTPQFARLIRQGGVEKRVRVATEGTTLDMAILPLDWKKWIFSFCRVSGRLVKRLPTQELGVYPACVEIYEVDGIGDVIRRLPERDLFRLRNDLGVILEQQISKSTLWLSPSPLPPQESHWRPGTLVYAKSLMDKAKIVQLNPQPEPPIPEWIAETFMVEKEATLPATETRTKLEPIFRATTSSQLRLSLVANTEILADLIYRVKWLWPYFHMDLIKCCDTNEWGRFKTTIYYSSDKPDLYFKARQNIGGEWYTVYDRGVTSHTYWNYECGTEVVLETDDPAAITCIPSDPINPPPGVRLWVMPYGVGGIRLDQIKSITKQNLPGRVVEKLGLTDFTDPDGEHSWVDAPFGGRLGFRHGYTPGQIPSDAPGKPFYYRWLYNKLNDDGSETEWHEFAFPVAETVVRHYIDEDLNHKELPPTFPAYLLGPQEKNNLHLYEFKPHEPPETEGHHCYWPKDEWFGDIYSGILQSVNLPGGVAAAAGKYKIKLEIYDKAVKQIEPGPDTFEFIVPTGVVVGGMTIQTRKADPREIQEGGFVFYLHIDNNLCQAEIYEASVKGVSAGPCGFISYGTGDFVHLSFRAYHPNGFARFKFTVVRGSSEYVVAACAPDNPKDVPLASAPLVTAAPVNGFNRSGASVFTKDVAESDMRSGCQQAAFGEDLYVAATATDGWTRLYWLDASAVPKAFALEPKET